VRFGVGQPQYGQSDAQLGQYLGQSYKCGAGGIGLGAAHADLGAIGAAVIMILSMFTNAQVDGFDYFLKVLPFDLGALAAAAVLAWHHRGDLGASGTPNQR